MICKKMCVFSMVLVLLLGFLPMNCEAMGQDKNDNAKSSDKEKKDDAFLKLTEKYLKKYPLPENSRPLVLKNSFPPKELRDQDVFFKLPNSIAMDSVSGNLFVADMEAHRILVFDKDGGFLRQIGKKGKEPGEFSRPAEVMIWNNQLIVNDVGNHRIQFLDMQGNYLKGFRIFRTYYQMAVGPSGTLYGAHFITYREPHIVDALDQDGKLLFSFGDTLEYNIGQDVSNQVRLAVDESSGEVYTVFTLFPLVRKYSPEGKMIMEIGLDYPILKDIDKDNRNILETMNRKKRLRKCLDDMRVVDGNVFIARYFPRLEIIRFDGNGKPVQVGWNNDVPRYHILDFLTRSVDESFVFYVARVSSERLIDIFNYK